MKSSEMVAEATLELAELAMAFGRIDRTGVCHPDGRPETDSDHTVMLCWIAPALADLVNEHRGFADLNVGLVCQYAAVHDAAEVYAGDTPTINISEEELRSKEERELMASVKLSAQFKGRLPWFSCMVREYERQNQREARFVRAVDKLMPKLVHVIDNLLGLKQAGKNRDDVVKTIKRQRGDMVRWLDPGARLVLEVYDIFTSRVMQLDWPEDAVVESWEAGSMTESHELEIFSSGVIQMHHHNCLHPADSVTCPFTLAYEIMMHPDPSVVLRENVLLLPAGKYPVILDELGELEFVDTEGK